MLLLLLPLLLLPMPLPLLIPSGFCPKQVAFAKLEHLKAPGLLLPPLSLPWPLLLFLRLPPKLLLRLAYWRWPCSGRRLVPWCLFLFSHNIATTATTRFWPTSSDPKSLNKYNLWPQLVMTAAAKAAAKA